MKDIRLLLRIKNNLILSRAEELWGKGIKLVELAKKIGVGQSHLGAVINFRTSPVRKKGKGLVDWTTCARVIADALNCEPEDIFPEHFRAIRNSLYQVEVESMSLLPFLDSNPELEMIKKEDAKTIINVLKTLRPREQKVLELRFGLNGNEESTLKEMGHYFGVSGNRIMQIENNALMKLRHYSRIRMFEKGLAA